MAKGLQLLTAEAELAWALEASLTPNDDSVSAVLVPSTVSDAQVCFPYGSLTEESSYEWKICLKRAGGFANVDAAISWSADVEPDALRGKVTEIAFVAPAAAK